MIFTFFTYEQIKTLLNKVNEGFQMEIKAFFSRKPIVNKVYIDIIFIGFIEVGEKLKEKEMVFIYLIELGSDILGLNNAAYAMLICRIVLNDIVHQFVIYFCFSIL